MKISVNQKQNTCLWFFEDNFYVSSKTQRCLHNSLQQRHDITRFPLERVFTRLMSSEGKWPVFLFIGIDIAQICFWEADEACFASASHMLFICLELTDGGPGDDIQGTAQLRDTFYHSATCQPLCTRKTWVWTFIKFKNGSSSNCGNTPSLWEPHTYLFFVSHPLIGSHLEWRCRYVMMFASTARMMSTLPLMFQILMTMTASGQLLCFCSHAYCQFLNLGPCGNVHKMLYNDINFNKNSYIYFFSRSVERLLI